MILKKPTAADVVSDRSGVTISQTVNMADSSNFRVWKDRSDGFYRWNTLYFQKTSITVMKNSVLTKKCLSEIVIFLLFWY